jgi:hypothetical protein
MGCGGGYMSSYKVYLLGAGASYDYDEKLPKNQRPPLTDELFIAGVRLGILTPSRYTNLAQQLVDYLKTQGKQASFDVPESLKVNVETFLSWLAKGFSEQAQLGHRVAGANYDFTRIQVMQNALGECRYFIYELLSSYALSYQHDGNCYHRLALSIKSNEDRCAIVTLNYDILLELALKLEGMNFNYLPSVLTETHGLPIAKLHGSINWANPRGRAIAYGSIDGGRLFSTVVQHIHSNTAVVDKVKIAQVGTRDNLLRSGTDYDEPVVVPPFGLYKDYEHFPFLECIWKFGENLIRSASEMVIIGCQLREEDHQLCQTLQSVMTNNTCITLVSPSYPQVEERLQRLGIGSRVVSRYLRFAEYVKAL